MGDGASRHVDRELDASHPELVALSLFAFIFQSMTKPWAGEPLRALSQPIRAQPRVTRPQKAVTLRHNKHLSSNDEPMAHLVWVASCFEVGVHEVVGSSHGVGLFSLEAPRKIVS